MKRLLLLTSLLLAFEVGAFAQMLPPDISMPENMHAAASVPVIDGSLNPELIPDSTAYRLFFVSVAEGANPAPEEVARHKSHLARIQLKDNDGQSLADALRTFKQQYDDLIKNYNGTADVAILQGEAPDYSGFLRQRDALVQTTRNQLKLAISPVGMLKLDALFRARSER
ncbi:MAG TPA: hypothetical protein VGN39_13375 [Terriglobales bacterium]|jgi:hypothetical protein|nr:hypothetical protein [Terriglobales bacterium]